MSLEAKTLPGGRRQPIPGDEVELLGVRFDRLDRAKTLKVLSTSFGRSEAWKIFIVNAHTLNLAWEDALYRQVLNQADLLLNDGSGVQIASWLSGESFPDNLVGTDLTPQLCEIAVRQGVGVFLLGGHKGVAEQAASTLRRTINGIKISGTQDGYFAEEETARIVESINNSGAGILLVAFGNPLQEVWIHKNSSMLQCDLCIGVGGLFDHLAGRLRRAPKWMRQAGIEWFHILLGQPHKWRRYLLGNPLFLARVIFNRLGWGP